MTGRPSRHARRRWWCIQKRTQACHWPCTSAAHNWASFGWLLTSEAQRLARDAWEADALPTELLPLDCTRSLPIEPGRNVAVNIGCCASQSPEPNRGGDHARSCAGVSNVVALDRVLCERKVAVGAPGGSASESPPYRSAYHRLRGTAARTGRGSRWHGHILIVKSQPYAGALGPVRCSSR